MRNLPINDNTKLLSLIKDLPEEELIAALPELRKLTQPEIIPSLIERWLQSSDDVSKDALFEFFIDSKVQSEFPYFMDAIRNEKYAGIRSELISVFWQSSLDSSESIAELTEIALKGDITTMLEVTTVFENYETSFNPTVIAKLIQLSETEIEKEIDIDRTKMLMNLQDALKNLKLK